ncbi:hypothetical protein cyc_02076 [Cyclospora cayetanensis]|uniref:Uncharacterized protein n=1 Tax=Cyclospora cayetanensis TaxID=88456 RepID=A0A1D3D082_9EIME|nr:hypothetical protein cyc_02076 [Cyclospora cayetanensis]
MDGTIASSGHRLYMMSQDLAFVEQRLIRAMAESQWDQSLTHALNKLRELREMVAAIQAMHTEVTSVWSSITAAARDQACCLRYIRTLKTAAEASESCTHPSEGLSAAGKEFSRSFCSKDFTVNAEMRLPAVSSDADTHDVAGRPPSRSPSQGASPAPVQ